MDIDTLKKIFENYDEQQRLFEYQNSRVLVRPKTKIVHVVFLTLAYLTIIALCIVINVKISVAYYYELPASIVIYWLISELSLRYIGTKIVECYQHYAKEKTRRKCLCVPSCSEYAIACFKKYELIKALAKIKKRLSVSCKGHIYIIDPP